MKKTIQSEEKQLIFNFRNLTQQKRQAAMDFIAYLITKSEWDATMEIVSDKAMMKGLKEGLAQAKRGDVSVVKFWVDGSVD